METMEIKTLTDYLVEYRAFTDKIERMYVEKKMRDSMGGDRGIHLGHIKRVTKLLEDRFVI
jgi:hypothetical protein